MKLWTYWEYVLEIAIFVAQPQTSFLSLGCPCPRPDRGNHSPTPMLDLQPTNSLQSTAQSLVYRPKLPWRRFAGDNLEGYINKICTFLFETSIPANNSYDENFLPTRSSESKKCKCIKVSTLTLYIGLHLLYIRRKCPTHEDFSCLQDDEYPAWWSTLRVHFEREFIWRLVLISHLATLTRGRFILIRNLICPPNKVP